MTVVGTYSGGVVATPPPVDPEVFFGFLRESVWGGGRVVALLGKGQVPDVELVAAVAFDQLGLVQLLRTKLADASYPSLTPELTQVHLFEREIREQTGLVPEGHPWLKPVRFTDPADTAGVTDFYVVEGESVHEVGVGPVHAGVIEPGHFRFQCHGETVFHLEIALGYQHRGVEAALLRGPAKRRLHLAETLAGDTTIGHATAYCESLEALGGARVPPRAQGVRAIALELERLANHVGDLGALAGDVAFLPTAAFCGRLRGDFLNLTALICGNRFGRSLVVPGGIQWDLSDELRSEIRRRLAVAEREVQGAVDLLWESASVVGRFQHTGVVTRETAEELGLVGVAARASGLGRDVRVDHPSGLYRMASLPVSVATSGDVYARARVRWLEITRSLAFIDDALAGLPEGPTRVVVPPAAPDRMVVTLVEGWRGEIAHVAATDGDGRVALYKVVDPSFHNWMGLAMALRDEAISDFPLCNKSFNLSYCGHDL